MKKLLCLAALAHFLGSAPVLAQQKISTPVGVAVLDAWVDDTDPDLDPAINQDLLQRLQTTREDGTTTNWLELNRSQRESFQKIIGAEHTDQEHEAMFNFLNFIYSKGKSLDSVSQEEKGKILGQVLNGFFKALTSKKYRDKLEVLGTYYHGTHVAGLVLNGRNANAIVYPIVSAPGKKTGLLEVMTMKPEEERESIRKTFDELTVGLQEAQVRVANLSIGASLVSSMRKLKKSVPWYLRPAFYFRMRKVSAQSVQVFKEELVRFFRANPNTVFVLAAGNDGTNMNQDGQNTGATDEPNEVVVASVDSQSSVSKFSNRGSQFADIAAVGESVPSDRVGGGTLFLTGTSQAAPQVANRMIQIFEKFPEFTVTQAIDYLKTSQTVVSAALSANVHGGLVMKEVPSDKASTNTLTLQIDQDFIIANLDQESLKRIQKEGLDLGAALTAALNELSSEFRKMAEVQAALQASGANELFVEIADLPNDQPFQLISNIDGITHKVACGLNFDTKTGTPTRITL